MSEPLETLDAWFQSALDAYDEAIATLDAVRERISELEAGYVEPHIESSQPTAFAAIYEWIEAEGKAIKAGQQPAGETADLAWLQQLRVCVDGAASDYAALVNQLATAAFVRGKLEAEVEHLRRRLEARASD
jgi:hypothetical protein